MELIEQLQGCVYLVQPDILIGTNRYKIGLTKQNDFSRLSKNIRVLCIRGCNNPNFIENEIKESFKQIFKLNEHVRLKTKSLCVRSRHNA